ncbi:MAG TPA: cytochrome c-type biogenesis protein CcmH [bacterium]|nr:cytochrome c-type biogenesis protein CcmH [bacterium]
MTGRRARASVTAAAAVLLLAAAAAVARANTLDDRIYAVASQLMCPVCSGQTVAESDSAVARQMRDVIRAKLQAGETPDAILAFFVGQFGESVLAEPPRRGLPLLLYLGPAAGAVGGLAIAVLCIRRWTGRPGRAAENVPPLPAGAAERARLARELDARDRL